MIEALAAAQLASWREGEDPPDAYLQPHNDSRNIAVEISILTQHVASSEGRVPRLAQDLPAIYMAEALNQIVGPIVPSGLAVMLTLFAPINEVRRTRERIASEIRDIFSTPIDRAGFSTDLQLNGNRLQLTVVRVDGDENKVFAAVVNRNSSSDILANAWEILEDRIAIKTRKCAELAKSIPVWLALFNDYGLLADADTYRNALQRMNVMHPFRRIILVGANSRCETLYDAT